MQVVIGAGPAGLATGWALRRQGHEVLVLEASDRIGGLAADIDVAGVRVGLGAGGLRPSLPPALRADLEEVVGLEERRRLDRVRVAGRWVRWPVSLAGLARSAPGLAARVALRAATVPRRRSADGSWAATARAAVGPALAEALHLPLAAKAWGTDPAELAGDRAPHIAAWSGPVTELRPVRGTGAVVEALAGGLRVETGRRVTRLIEHPDRVIVGLSDGRVVTAAHVHAALPAWQVAAMVGLHGEPEPPSRALVQVFLVVDGRPYGRWETRLLPDPRLLPVRVADAAGPGGDPARTVLRADVPCWAGDHVWQATDEALVRRVADDLVRVGLPDPRPVAVHVERLPAVAPVPTRRSLALLGWSERALGGSARVTVVGRPGFGPPGDLHHDLLSGVAAARRAGPGGFRARGAGD